ncbi:hypothetical protein [Neobacillus sp. Marseille-QA0830]
MKKGKVYLLLLLASLFISVVTGCGNTETSTQKEQPVSSEEGKKAKAEIMAKLQDAKNYNKQIEEQVGYLTREEYTDFSNDVNLIAYGIGTETRIEYNDDEDIQKSLDTLDELVNQLSDQEALKAKKLMNSSQAIYTIAIQEDLNSAMKAIDLTSSDNNLNSFISNSNQLTDSSEITKEVDSTIDSIKSEEWFLDNVKKAAAKYSTNFSDKELSLLNGTTDSLTSSVNKQIHILEQLKPGAIEDGSSPDEQLNSAMTDYNDAETNVTKLEDGLKLNE